MDPGCAAGTDREKNVMFHRNKIQWGKNPTAKALSH